jgi:transposase
MATTRRKFTREFKVGVVREVEAGKTVAQVSREYQVHPTQIDQWRRDLRRYGERAFAGNGRAYTDEARTAALERKIGQLAMENDLLKKALAALESRPDASGVVKKKR